MPMNEDGRRFLTDILWAASPTGDEQRLQRLIREWADPWADRIDSDLHGNLAVIVKPGGARYRRPRWPGPPRARAE